MYYTFNYIYHTNLLVPTVYKTDIQDEVVELETSLVPVHIHQRMPFNSFIYHSVYIYIKRYTTAMQMST